MNLDRITFDPNIMGGKACIRGMRITVSLVVNLVANGMSRTEIIAAYPYLEDDDITQALRYAAWAAGDLVTDAAQMMRFLADMGVSPVCVEHLRSLGYDAVHLYEQGLHRLADSEIIRKADDESRIILTSDLDFGYLVAVSRASTPTIVLFRLSDMRPPNVSAHLDTVIERHSHDLEQGVVVVVTDTHIRVRRLPIGSE